MVSISQRKKESGEESGIRGNLLATRVLQSGELEGKRTHELPSVGEGKICAEQTMKKTKGPGREKQGGEEDSCISPKKVERDIQGLIRQKTTVMYRAREGLGGVGRKNKKSVTTNKERSKVKPRSLWHGDGGRK